MTLPAWLTAVLPRNTAEVWEKLVPLVPDTCYLAGGTAVAVHIRHRESRDLDFFYHHDSVNLDDLRRGLEAAGEFVVTKQEPGTLNGLFEQTKLQFMHADEGKPEHLIAEPTIESGFRIAGIPDLLAMKLKTLQRRGEHRDYFDLQSIEQMTPYTVDEGLSYFVARHQPEDPESAISTIIRALGYMGDVDEDEAIPFSKNDVQRYWQKRQPEILKSAGRLTSGGTPPPATTAPTEPTSSSSGSHWVEAHKRGGRNIKRYRRGRP